MPAATTGRTHCLVGLLFVMCDKNQQAFFSSAVGFLNKCCRKPIVVVRGVRGVWVDAIRPSIIMLRTTAILLFFIYFFISLFNLQLRKLTSTSWVFLRQYSRFFWNRNLLCSFTPIVSLSLWNRCNDMRIMCVFYRKSGRIVESGLTEFHSYYSCYHGNSSYFLY